MLKLLLKFFELSKRFEKILVGLEKLQDSQEFILNLIQGLLQPEKKFHATFMIMTLLGPNLSTLLKKCPCKHFSLSTAVRVGIQTLEAIEALHRVGFLSRDIKPQNFAIGVGENGANRRIVMFDFGLACRYLDEVWIFETKKHFFGSLLKIFSILERKPNQEHHIEKSCWHSLLLIYKNSYGT